MSIRRLTTLVTLAAGLFGLAAANRAPLDLSVRTYNAPGHTEVDIHQAIRRGLAEARHQKRDELKGNVTLDRSWDGAVLLKTGASQSIDTGNNASSASVSGAIEIICTTCYVKGLASAELQITDNFDAGEALNQTKEAVFETVHNFTEEVEQYFEEYFSKVATNLKDGIDWHDFEFPTLNYTFDMDIPAIPDVTLNFQFDDMELYLELNTILSAGSIYELNLFTSNTPIGMGVGEDVLLGVVFKVDLLLSVEGTIDISSGLHIKLDDGVSIDIALFSDVVSNIVLNGGQFEFLPVTVEKAGVVLSAILRIGIHSGMAVAAPGVPKFSIFNTTLGSPEVAGGIEVGVYANLAEFTTNVTYAPDDEDCEFKVVQEYQIALGAVAGASIVFDTDTWGPVAATSIPIWNTALAEACAKKGTKTPAIASATPTPTAQADKREDLETMTTETKITHTGMLCITSVIGNCPNSLQSTTQTVETRTLTTAVPSGEDVTWPETLGVTNSVKETRGFGDNALSFTATSGSPTSYTPPPPTSTSTNDDDDGDDIGSKTSEVLNGKTGGLSNKVIIGVSVGLGIPIIIAIIAAIVLIQRKRSYKAVPAPSFAPENRATEPYQRVGGDGFEPYRFENNGKEMMGVNVREVGR